MARIKKGDQVIVIAGKDKGKTGRVLKVMPDVDRVVVEGVQRVTKHTRICSVASTSSLLPQPDPGRQCRKTGKSR